MMPLYAAAPVKPGSWPITVGAAGIAAAQFARCGFDVLSQAGHDKPWYDLVVTKGGNLLKIGVKASEDGCWRLAETYLHRAAQISGKKNDMHRAITLWLDIHGDRTVYCLVQFEGVALNQLPRIYLATPADIARRMREAADRTGQPSLYEQYQWTSSDTGNSEISTLPGSWLFSHERIHDLLFPQTAQPIPMPPARVTPGNVTTMELRPAAMTA
jgi:hypothetical protein